jgi:toxin ParE1/3/4
MHVIIAPKARDDISSILTWTEANFRPKILKRYARLLARAIEEIGENPECRGSIHRPEIAVNCRTYHLYFSRNSSGVPMHRIRNSRHLLLYRVMDSNVVELGRVLHDSMDFDANLPDEYRNFTD